MSTPAKHATSDDAKKAGWFSRRHQTAVEHQAEQERWQQRQLDKRIDQELCDEEAAERRRLAKKEQKS